MFHRMAKRLNEARRRERAIISYSADVIFTLDLNFKFTLVSDASQRLWGYAPFELEGKPIDVVMEKGESERIRKEFSALTEGEAMRIIECTVRRRGESPVFSLWSVFRSQSEATIFCVAHDITERKELERLRNEFMTMVSHDVRSPLSSLAATYHLLATGALGELTERGKKLTQGGVKTIERLIALISDLLDLDRLDAGKLALEIREIPSSTLFAETLDSTQAAADKKRIKIEVQDPEVSISCDPDRIVQVLVNLTGNSLKFAPDHSTVFLSLDVVNDCAEFRVKDQGRGIPEEKIDSLFSRYSQVEHTDATNKGGSGLGLAICKSLVEAHRGTVGVESEIGVGSTFWFRIPLND
jgi:PAS domain S-box-containing protein